MLGDIYGDVNLFFVRLPQWREDMNRHEYMPAALLGRGLAAIGCDGLEGIVAPPAAVPPRQSSTSPESSRHNP